MLALEALACGQFELVAPALREALRGVREDADIAMPVEVWDALTGVTFARISASPGWHAMELSERDEIVMGEFWLGIARGEPTEVPR